MKSTEPVKGAVALRCFKEADAADLAKLANDKTIFDNVRDYFPYPYTLEDAKAFISSKLHQDPWTTFTIAYNGDLAGMADIKLQSDVYRKSGEVGYWIGAPFRGRGIATVAVTLITHYGINKLGLNRLYAGVFSSNPTSMQVLKKCGYLFEGISKQAVWKNDRFLDLHQFAYVV